MNFLVFLSTYILPFFIFYVVAYGLLKGRNVYQAFVEGAKGGFHTALGILPTLVGFWWRWSSFGLRFGMVSGF